MPRLRLVLLAAAAMLLLSAAPAWGYSRPSAVVYNTTLSTPHFVVHYTSDPTHAEHLDQTIAGEVGAYAERAYALFVSQWGYPAPADDGDGKTDLYVVDLTSATSGTYQLTLPDNESNLQSTAFVELDYSQGLTPQAIAHAVFDAIGLGVWNPSNRSLLEGAAEWGAFAVNQYAGATANVGGLDVSLDCNDPTDFNATVVDDGHGCGHVGTGFVNSATDNAREIGSARWPFFEYLSERYGTGAMLSIMQSGLASGLRTTSPASLLDTFLASKGTSLTSFYDDWTLAAMTGAFTPVPLQTLTPVAYQSVLTGTLASLNVGRDPLLAPLTTGAIPTIVVPVDHLGVRYLAFTKGDGVDTGPCFAASLTVTVTLPGGVSAKPYFQWGERNALGKLVQSAIPLSVNGTTASATVPWDTCKWQNTVGLLSLANDSLTADSLDFTVSGSITIDTSTVGAGSSAPPQVAMPGTVVAAPTQDVVPTIDLLGPAVIHVDGNDTGVRVVLDSSGPGKVQVSLGTISLGTFNLRAGTNVVDVALSGPAEQALVGARTAGMTMTLTPLALPGGAGPSVGCTVVLDPLTVTTTKTKAKAKTKAKVKRHVVKRRAR